jgi:DNA-directed RNA polymerase delta subunit
LRKHGKPLHFTEVAEQVEEMFNRPAHVATTHNELIKDDRFVLVGRGLYALSEWGYSNGVVRDVIRTLLKDKGPMTKEQIIAEVLKQRQVKENTIYVNLQNANHFKKDAKNRYAPVV